MSEATDESHPTREFSAGQRIYVLAILMGVNLFNYMDRAIQGVLIQPIKEEFNAMNHINLGGRL